MLKIKIIRWAKWLHFHIKRIDCNSLEKASKEAEG